MTTRDYVLAVYEGLRHTIELRMIKDAFVTDVKKENGYTGVYVTLQLSDYKLSAIISEECSLTPGVQVGAIIALFEQRQILLGVPDSYLPTFGPNLTKVLAQSFVEKAEQYLSSVRH